MNTENFESSSAAMIALIPHFYPSCYSILSQIILFSHISLASELPEAGDCPNLASLFIKIYIAFAHYIIASR